MIRVAVIDSGVHAAHPHIIRVDGGASFGHSDRASYNDSLGHGTAVMAAVQEKAPDAEYYALRVFHSALRTRVEFLIEALEWCLTERIDIVNLSLGTSNPDHAARFEMFLRKAPNLVVVAPAGSLPGSHNDVLAADEDPT
ncbi:MAG TPA: S8 family serine peptidase [Bryobacteraceae bacterium]